MISIDELHEYASRKVREVKPDAKPEIYAIREGFKIRLCKVPQGDPHERYKKEVARCGKRGELTIVSRSILDTWRVRLGLSVEAAKASEDEVLAPYRRDFQQKLQRYEQTVTEVLQRDGLINDSTRQELQQLQQVLELRNEDTVPIEARVTAHLKTHKQNRETYQQSFSEALRQEYPLGEASRSRLQQMRQHLALSDADVAPIEAQVATEVETYRRNLQQYEQAFLAATQQDYPLSESKRAELRQCQSSLGLSEVEIAPIEAKVTTQIETYQQKLQQYEEAFASATQRKHQPGEANRTQLRQTWQTLGLNEADVKAIEAPILAQVETYQANLRQYEQAFVDATEQEYPLSQAKRSELRQRQQALSLSDEDITPIENRITASTEDHLKKLQQYEQVFSDSIQFEFPVSEATREELRRFQHVLELGDEEVTRIEEKFISQNERSPSFQHVLELGDEEVTRIEEKFISQNERSQNQSSKADTSHRASQTAGVVAQEDQNSEAQDPRNVCRSQSNEETVRPEDGSVASKKSKMLIILGSIFAIVIGAAILPLLLGKQDTKPTQSPPTVVAQDKSKDFFDQGLAKFTEKDYKGAIRDFDEAIRLKPDDAAAYNSRGSAKSNLGDKQGAIKDFDEAIRLKPDYADAYWFRGAAKLNLGDNQGAIKDFDEAIRLKPDYADAYWFRGAAKLNLGDKQGAVKDFDEAIRLKPDDALAYWFRGLAKSGLGDKQGAIKDYDEAIRLKPDDANAYWFRGLAKSDLGDKQGAIQDYQDAAKLYQQQGKTEDYRDALNQIEKLKK